MAGESGGESRGEIYVENSGVEEHAEAEEEEGEGIVKISLVGWLHKQRVQAQTTFAGTKYTDTPRGREKAGGKNPKTTELELPP